MSERINDGGPVYPTQRENCEKDWGETGMTLRDHFAGLELAKADPMQCQVGDYAENYDRLARHCYKIADAMLKARESS